MLRYNLYRNWPWQFQGMCSVCACFRSCVWPKKIVLLQARWKIVRTSSSLHTPHSTVNKVCLNWEKWQRGKCGVLFWAEFPTVSATVSTRSTFHLLQVSLLPIPFRNMGNPTETCTCKTFGEQKSICDSFDWKCFLFCQLNACLTWVNCASLCNDQWFPNLADDKLFWGSTCPCWYACVCLITILWSCQHQEDTTRSCVFWKGLALWTVALLISGIHMIHTC